MDTPQFKRRPCRIVATHRDDNPAAQRAALALAKLV